MPAGHQYDFGRFRLDVGSRMLFRDGKRISLTPKAIDVLIHLVGRGGSAVTRQELLLSVWADAVVEEGTLNSHISLLRKTLGGEFIETIPKRGYRFVGPVGEKRATERILLAVLPFENLSGGKKYDSFSDGLTEEMIAQLGRINPIRLGVIARTSTMTYKSTEKTIEQIGRELGVSHVLEGSARRAANRVRVTAQLIQVSDQTHVWADTYEGTLEDILVLQSRVAHAVAKQIQVRLLPAENARQVVADAYEVYLKGRYLWSRRTEHDLQMSLSCFVEAAAKDPHFAAPYAGMADAWLSLMDAGFLRPHGTTSKARETAMQALELDPNLAEAYISLAHAALHEFDWLLAERNFARGIELNPNYSAAHFYFCSYLVAHGRLEEAVAEAEEARRLDPLSPRANTNLASILWYSRHYERSVAQSQKALELHPDDPRAYEDMGRAYEQLGDFPKAIEAFHNALALGQSPDIMASLAHTFALDGGIDKTREILRRLEEMAQSSFVSAYDFALVYFALGRNDEAFRWFDRAHDERSTALPFIKANPRFVSLHGEPRFQDLVRRLGIY